MIKLVQLPIPEVHHLYTQGNIPLAAAYLKTSAVSRNVLSAENIHIIPRHIANLGGDAAILDWLLEDNTPVIGFSNYMWNIERNLHLARRLKEAKPDITILFGGPEIHPNLPLLDIDYVDVFFEGEGEQLFIDFLEDRKLGKPVKRWYQNRAPLDLSAMPNPYLEKILTPEAGESMFLETMRGCPYSCKYCFYSKSFNRMRFFPEEQLKHQFALARDKNVPEIYLMDPSFNVTPHMEKRLRWIGKLNPTGIPIHTEIRLESVTPSIAKAMKTAGFHSVEVGLQSVNETSLAAIGRTWNREKFIRGAELLQEQGIDAKTGVILGLPHDGLDDFERTIDFVINLGLEDSMEIYPLSLIPGTQLRDEASKLGILHMPPPPYWVTETPHLDEKDFKAAVEMIENKLGIEFFPPVIPRFENIHPSYIHFLDLRRDAEAQLTALYAHPERLGHSLTVLLDETTPKDQITALGRRLQQFTPSTLVQLVMDTKDPPPESLLDEWSKTFHPTDHYFDRVHHYKMDTQAYHSLRFFHLTDDPDMAENHLYRPYPCDLIVRYTPKLLQHSRDILEEKPILLIDSAVSQEEKKELKQIYDGFEDFIIFKNPGGSFEKPPPGPP